MATLPRASQNNYSAESKEYPTYTWAILDGRIAGMIDGQEAMRQTVEIILNAERYRYQIYSPVFGVELVTLLGKDRDYVESMVKRRIQEALLMDERILAVEEFRFQYGQGTLLASFEVRTVYGAVTEEVAI